MKTTTSMIIAAMLDCKHSLVMNAISLLGDYVGKKDDFRLITDSIVFYYEITVRGAILLSTKFQGDDRINIINNFLDAEHVPSTILGLHRLKDAHRVVYDNRRDLQTGESKAVFDIGRLTRPAESDETRPRRPRRLEDLDDIQDVITKVQCRQESDSGEQSDGSDKRMGFHSEGRCF